MCFYNGINISRATHIKLNQVEKEIGEMREAMQRPLQSGFEFSNWPVLVGVDGGKDFRIELMHWELIPFYVKNGSDLHHFRHGGINPRTGKKDPPRNTLNAIGEEMLDKISYKQAALKRRCLVLSSGFYEWRHFTPSGSKKDQAYPYHITVKGKEYFFMAGIWQPWTDQETGETMDTFSIVTTAANPLMAQVHNKKNRMPLILPDELAGEWIREGLSPKRITDICHFQYSAAEMSTETIRKDFRTASDPLLPETYPELPALMI
jgi:putative SOS response-associated peptidase YedK